MTSSRYKLTSSDWRLPKAARLWLADHIYPNAILELGVGDGTRSSSLLSRIYGVDDNFDWLQVAGVIGVHCPIVDGWYHTAPLALFLADKHYGAVVVDGPVNHRSGLLKHLDMFPDVPFLVDDVHRPVEMALAWGIAEARDKSLSVHYLPDGRAFAVVGKI